MQLVNDLKCMDEILKIYRDIIYEFFDLVIDSGGNISFSIKSKCPTKQLKINLVSALQDILLICIFCYYDALYIFKTFAAVELH